MQVDFPGLGRERNEEIEAAAAELAGIREEKKTLSLREQVAALRLLEAMRSAGARIYDSGDGLRVRIEATEKVKVDAPSRTDEEDEA